MSTQEVIRMLSIDDKSITTDLDRAGYRKMGVVVKPASNYEEARRILASEAIDLVVINLDFGGADGIQITRHLKAQPESATLPVVLTSVRTTAKVRSGALDAGADLFVEQPLPRQYFIEKLKQLLEQKTRTTERVDAPGDARFSLVGVDQSCPIGDLSMSGLLLSTDLEIEDGAILTLEFDLPGNKKPIKVTGEVVRTIKFNKKTPDRPTGIGVRFADFSGDSERRLERYIAKTTHTDGKMHYYL